MRIGMVIDLEKCIGCRTCAIACKQHNAQPPGNWWNQVNTPGSKVHMTTPDFGVEYYLPVACQHCDKPACEKVCPEGATFKDKDGTILIDFDRCTGCRFCMTACPYGVRQFNWESGKKANKKNQYISNYTFGYPIEHRRDKKLVYTPSRPRGVVEKCSMCVQYRDQGDNPACIKGCTGNARYIGDLDDPNSEVSKLIRDRGGFNLLPEKGTKPKVFYLPPKRKDR